MSCPDSGEKMRDDTVVSEMRDSGPAPSAGGAEGRGASDYRITDRVKPGQDGVYRWIYEMSLLKNPTIFLLVWKIFFFILLAAALIAMIHDAFDYADFFPVIFLQQLKIWGIVFAGMTVLVALGYLLYAAIMGGKYVVLFEMDEKGVNHKQLPKQAKKAEKIAALTVLGGLAAGNPTTVGVGLNSARTEMYSEFRSVRKVKGYPHRGLIKVNGVLSHNQVYVQKDDYDFVKGYIESRCDKINKKP